MQPAPKKRVTPDISSEQLAAPQRADIGIGRTADFDLLVSTSGLTLPVVKAPATGQELLMLERVVRVSQDGKVTHQVQPIGGAMPISNGKF